MLSPFGKMDGMYFDETDEPDDFAFQLAKDLERIYEKKGITYIKLNFENKDDFYNALVSMQKFSNDNVTLYGTSREGHYEIVVDTDEELDDTVSLDNDDPDEK